MFKDELTDWYKVTKAPPLKNNKNDPYWADTFLEPNSHILSIGPTGVGKTQGLCEYIKRRGGDFRRIIIFLGCTDDEHLYNNLRKKNPQIEFYTDIDEVPSIQEIQTDEDFDNEGPNLIVFDDFINLPSKKMTKLCDWIIAGRKLSFTVYLLSQDYTDVPKKVRRNISYLFINKQRDKGNLNYVLRQHNFGLPKDVIFNWYSLATRKNPDFFLIDLKTTDPRLQFRHNYRDLFNIQEVDEEEEDEKEKTKTKRKSKK